MKEGTKQVKFCIHCGAEFPSGAKFCPDCGKPRHVAAERPATENPVVAGTASVLSDPKKRRVAFVAIAVVVVLVLGIALLAGGREAAPQGDDLPDVPPVSDGAEGSGETFPQDEGQTDSETAVDTDQTMDIVPEKPVDPADHIFPDLEAFFGLPLEKDNEHNARGWRWQFEDVKPYDQLEAVKSELLALLQEPRWQLELVDEEHAVYETGDMNAADHYYFQYTGTAALTQIEDDLGLRLDHVNVVFTTTRCTTSIRSTFSAVLSWKRWIPAAVFVPMWARPKKRAVALLTTTSLKNAPPVTAAADVPTAAVTMR